jgi:hypothetical protein
MSGIKVLTIRKKRRYRKVCERKVVEVVEVVEVVKERKRKKRQPDA